ncbi:MULTISPECIES: SDR family NAD(P)-dependent oxidoreductase [Maribacter]|uniref:Short chain dehydrogenase n=2 Tax=Maribacter TaxID=252356 RepID=A0A1H4SA56_9FLAO|nr:MULTISPECIES: SDR family oxidoreductase [Maribacter]HAF77843.1 oxidoreductase [Maribacter sp.]MBU2902734.1 SDR family oxidoreductase [Maribacter dokdonensis]CAG2532554.1 short chain dehydrogenase [Maribacter dokdonensis]SEC40928.1 short chain dehydrogenase [Maribacter dokdonensis]SNR46484.1 short chain dehydrogenase [Maribacter sedimenticola]|tara:strand:- start:73985 stop:75535 length:1551 start_codon:yes stop_codon:yes gene_type:complete
MKEEQQYKETEIDLNEIESCIDILNRLVNDTNQIFEIPEDRRIALIKAAGQLSRPSKQEFAKRVKDAKRNEKRKQAVRDKHARKETGIRSAREAHVFVAPKLLPAAELASKDLPELTTPRNCYVCKAEFTKLHHFYDTMCTDCGDFNYAKRFQTANVKGQVAVITGSRLKIGYHITLMLLRGGATVIATTRFPVDSALRFSKEEDFMEWGHRLKIHGLDLRHIPSVEIFCNFVEQQYDKLDILINNAAQTVRRPAGFYHHLMENEEREFSSLPKFAQMVLSDHESCLEELKTFSSKASPNQNMPVTWHGPEPGIGLRASAQLSQIPYSFDNALVAQEVFPTGELDADLQQVDLRKTNSWRLKLGEIETTEMIEVQLVNSVAPFVLCNRLAEMMKKENTGQKHIINVTAMEGKFHRFFKESRHPHTNMAKAALNMLTHTAAGELAKDGIFMNAVDTGWVTDEDPAELAKKKQEVHDFQPPLDIVDGAARVMDPLFDGINTGKHWCGKFLKDYFPIDW